MSVSQPIYSNEYDEEKGGVRQHWEHDPKWECPFTPMMTPKMGVPIYSSEYDEDDDEVRQHCEHQPKWECPSTPVSMMRMVMR